MIVAAAAVATLMAALVACSTTSNASSGSSVDLKVWGWRQEDAATYKSIFAIYEKEHPGVTVTYVPYKSTEYDTILQTGLSGADGPDVAQLRAYGSLEPLIASGDLVALDTKSGNLSKFPATTLDGARGKDGKVYGVPFAYQTLQIFYNKEIFKKLGLTPPTTWNEMISDFKAVKEAGYTPLAHTVADTWMLPVQHEIFGSTLYGGQEFADKLVKGEAKYSDSDWVDSVTGWLSTEPYWGDAATSRTYAEAQALFTSGKAAMFSGGIYELAGFKKANPDLKMGLFSVPAAPGATVDHPITPGYVDGSFGVSTKSTHKKAALALVKWMAGQEFGKAFSTQLNQLSAVPGVTPADPILKEAAKAYEEHPGPYAAYIYINDDTPGAFQLNIDNLSKVVLGQETAQEAGDAIQSGIDQWYKPTK